VPPDICEVGWYVEFRGQERLIDDGVGDTVPAQHLPSLGPHPGEVVELDCELVIGRQNVKE